jgi:hypothetical protein
MLKIFFFTLAACVAGSVAAQNSTRPDPADPKAAVPLRAYESAFKGYRPYGDADVEVARWRQSNDEAGGLKGRMGHVARETGATVKPGVKLPAPSSHGGHK